jgi:hypothetical protein
MLGEILERDRQDRLPGFDSRVIRHLSRLAHPSLATDIAQVAETIDRGLGASRRLRRAFLEDVTAGLFNLENFFLLFSNQLLLLRRMDGTATVLEATLRGTPDESLGDDERVAQALVLAVRAVLDLARGDVERMRAHLREADARLGSADGLLDARERAIAAGSANGRQGLAAYGPFLRMVLLLGRGIFALRANQLKAAEGLAYELVELARGLGRRELLRAGVAPVFAAKIDATAPVLRKLVRLALAVGAKDWAGAAKARREVLEAISRLDLRVPGAAGDWLALGEVYARDMVYILDVAFGDGKTDPRLLEVATDRLIPILERWKKEGTGGEMGRHALTLAGALQRALPDVSCLRGDLDWDALARCARRTAFKEALQTIAREVQAPDKYPPERRLAEIANDKLQMLLLDLFVSVLPEPAGDLRRYQLPQVIESIERRARELSQEVDWRQGAHLRPLLSFGMGLALALSDREAEAVREWIPRGRAASAGTLFAGQEFVWDLLQFYALMMQGGKERDPASRQAMEAAQSACPALAWQLELGRARTLLYQGKTRNAYAALDRYIAGALTSMSGNQTVGLNVVEQQGGTTAEFKLLIPLRWLTTGWVDYTFQFGAGWRSPAMTARNWSWDFQPDDSPLHAIGLALVLRAWWALNHDDEDVAGRALADLIDLGNGMEARWLLKRPPADARNHAGPQPVQDPLQLLWIGTLAELHGHRLQGEALIKLAFARWVAIGDDGRKPQCGANEKRPLPEGTPQPVQVSQCQVPRPFFLYTGNERLRPLVHLRARRWAAEHLGLAALAVPDDVWERAVATARREAPDLLPSWVPDLDRAYRTKDAGSVPEGAEGAALAALAALGSVPPKVVPPEYACEAAAVALDKKDPAALDVAEHCGAATYTLFALQQAIEQTKNPDQALVYLRRGMDLGRRYAQPPQPLAAMTNRLLVLYLEHRPEETPAIAREQAAALLRLGWPADAITVRTLALATECLLDLPPGEPPGRILEDARRGGIQNPATRFLKRLLLEAASGDGIKDHATRVRLARRLLAGGDP